MQAELNKLGKKKSSAHFHTMWSLNTDVTGKKYRDEDMSETNLEQKRANRKEIKPIIYPIGFRTRAPILVIFLLRRNKVEDDKVFSEYFGFWVRRKFYGKNIQQF